LISAGNCSCICRDFSAITREVTVNKTELIGKISEVSELSRREAEKALDSMLYAISSAVKGGDAVRITGFGTFRRPRAARTGRNPQTGAAVKIKASNGIGFAAGATLKSQLNARGAIPKPGGAAAPAKKAAAAKAPAAKAPAKKAAAAKAPAAKAPAKKAVVAKAPAKKAAAAKAPAKKAVVAKAPAKKAPAKKAARR
jgi:DNA-binding protein HU-beta